VEIAKDNRGNRETATKEAIVTSTQSNVSGVLAAVQRDHREIEQLISNVESRSGHDRREAFEDLVRKLAVHETAEEEVVHPLGKKAGIDDTVDELLEEESQAKSALAKLDGLDVSSTEFERGFAKLKTDVMAHAQQEEQEEHPRLMQETPAEELERRASIFETAEKFAPTRAHEHAPESAAGNLVLGPIVAATDRMRDALRDAMRGKD